MTRSRHLFLQLSLHHGLVPLINHVAHEFIMGFNCLFFVANVKAAMQIIFEQNFFYFTLQSLSFNYDRESMQQECHTSF
jgi:hypothetical protein